MEKQDFKAKEGDIIKVQYKRREDLYDRVGFLQFVFDKEISLLSCKESTKSLKGGSFLKKLKGTYNIIKNSIKNSLEEPDNRYIDIPYNSILEFKVLEEKTKQTNRTHKSL